MCDQEYKAGVVYLDNAATTRMAEEAEAAMQPYLVAKNLAMHQRLTGTGRKRRRRLPMRER